MPRPWCTSYEWYVQGVDAREAIAAIGDLLDSEVSPSASTSMRLPAALRDAAALAVRELHVADSTTMLTAQALRRVLEGVVMDAALEAYFDDHPRLRPSLGDLAVAAALADGHPLASQPERLRQAAVEIVATHPDADADDVLLWAEARSRGAA